MWEAVVAPGRLADAEAAVRAAAARAGAGAECYSDGADRVVLITPGDASYDIDPDLVTRAHGWTFERL